jgi:exosortase J
MKLETETPSGRRGVTIAAARPEAAWRRFATCLPRLPAMRVPGRLVLLIALGALGIAEALLDLWDVWTNDPLRSIGMLLVPAALILLVRVWRGCGWDSHGTWWGMAALLIAFVMSSLRSRAEWNLYVGGAKLDLLAPKLILCIFVSGVVLLFAGPRVWRRAWFPLALLLCAQPVPSIASRVLDLPLQNLSAHIARSFAAAIGFSPSNTELLRLMFTPSFGMFIAPGCDGLRGAVTLGYAALIAGYLKRVSIARWIGYVCGAVLLGYIFNLLRLCGLVVYYRIAVGHHALERIAKQADYAIGGCLILLASFLFLQVIMRKTEDGDGAPSSLPAAANGPAAAPRLSAAKSIAFAFAGLLFALPGAGAIRSHQKSFAAKVNDGAISAAQLDALMPQQLGGYKRSRAWQEEANGRVAVESAAYDMAGSDEIVLGVWLPPSAHSMHESWRARGEDPMTRGNLTFSTAGASPVPFDAAFYSDRVNDSFAGNAVCTPASCTVPQRLDRAHIEFTLRPAGVKTSGGRSVSIFFRVETPHGEEEQAAVRQRLAAEAQRFLSTVDFLQLSREFQ